MALENFGPYQLIRKLAAGGMAQIYLARQRGVEGFEKLVVVKRILPHLNENAEFVSMFLQEAKTAARLNHPNIVQIFDLGQEDRSYYIAMEFIHGEDLRRVWKRAEGSGNSIPVPLVCRVIIDACNGLDYAHKKVDQSGKPLNIVHRDISPQNILVTYSGGVKVVDFGIAKAADQATVTRSGVLKGKYSYMSPEQAAGQKIDRRTDIFALGIVLYELLTNTRLFKRSNDVQTLNAVGECVVVPPSQVNPRVPADLDAVVLKALAKNADERYQHAVELQLALEDWLISHRLPSSSAHLSVFMNELYAERLAREARAGGPAMMLEDGGHEAAAREPATPERQGRPSSRSSSRRERDEGRPESTSPQRTSPTRSLGGRRSERLEVSGRKTRDDHVQVASTRSREASVPTAPGVRPPPIEERSQSLAKTEISEILGTRRRGLVWIAALVAIAALAILAWPVLRSSSTAAESPEQAMSTPPERSNVPAVTVSPAPPTSVRLSLRATPRSADIFVDGVEQGRGEATIEAPAGAVVRVTATASGYEPLDRQIIVGGGPEQHETLTLEREPVREVRPVRDVRRAPEPKEVRPAYGTVRFTVLPITTWATVACDGERLGDTPMPDQKLAVGVHECTFTNPDHGTLEQRVDVRATGVTKVPVDFRKSP